MGEGLRTHHQHVLTGGESGDKLASLPECDMDLHDRTNSFQTGGGGTHRCCFAEGGSLYVRTDRHLGVTFTSPSHPGGR